jgi:hypothetical protein
MVQNIEPRITQDNFQLHRYFDEQGLPLSMGEVAEHPDGQLIGEAVVEP